MPLICARLNKISSTCIDHVLYTNNEALNSQSFAIGSKKTDHQSVGVYFDIDLGNDKTSDKRLMFVHDYDTLNNLLSTETWALMYSAQCVNEEFVYSVSHNYPHPHPNL